MIIYAAIIISLLTNVAVLIYAYILNKKNKEEIVNLKVSLETTDARMRKVLTNAQPADPPSPNKATKEDEREVPLSEQSPWQIPQDVKIEIEGGDSIAPYGYEVTNANS